MTQLKLANFASIVLLILAAAAVSFVLLQPEITNHKGRTTVSTNAAIFYLPSLSPIKIFTLNPTDPKLQQIIKTDTQNIDTKFGIYIKNLNTKQQATLNENEQFTSASLYKLFVMYTIFDKADKGELDINKQDVKENLEAMITVSSNEAALYLVERYTSWQEVTDKMHGLGLNSTDLTQENLVTTPSDVAKLLELMANGKAVNFDSSVKMLELMTNQTRRDRIPQPLPDSAVVANKTGELDDVLHDAGVVGTDKSDYIIVLMSKESKSLDQTRNAMRKISEDTYNLFNDQWDYLPEIL